MKVDRKNSTLFNLRVRIAFMVCCAGLCTTAHAQYFEPRAYEPSEARYVAAGVFFRDFAPRATNSAPESLKVNYKTVMPFLSFRQGSVDVSFGYTSYSLRGATRAAIFAASTFTNDVPLAGSRGSTLILPFLIAADFSKSESTGSDRDDFNVASVGIGTGLKYRSVGESIDFAVSAVGAIHYSFEGFNLRSGSSTAVLGEAIALFRRIPVLEGIAAGYRFRWQSWSTDGNFDYRTVNHGFFVGVMF